MGAIPFSKGVAFRVWAPNAEKVFVTGTFINWDEQHYELLSEGNGFWYTEVSEAQPGDEYKYILFYNNQKLIKNDPYAKEVTNSAGNSIIVDNNFNWEDDGYQIPSWNELVIFEMHVGTFNTPQRDMPGNFKSVIKKIPYLKKLGINAIEIMPPMEFPDDYSWGYNPAYPFAVESSYGSSKEFKVLINEAHKAGIAVILDVVYNHFGPDDMDIWQFDGWKEGEYGGIYFYNDWRAETPWGNTRPDYGRDEVRTYLRDNAIMWLDEFHVDGLRLDATAFIRNVKGLNDSPTNDIEEGWSFMQWINEEVQKHFPGRITIAEDLCNNAWLTKTTGEGGAGFGSQWNNSFANEVRANIITNDDDLRDMDIIANQIKKHIDDDITSRVIYTESHDEIANGKARVAEEIWPGNVDNWFSRKRSVLGAALVLTSAGIPMIFQGQEFLEDRWFYDKDPLDWNLSNQYAGLVDLYKTLIELRKNTKGTTKGLTGQHVEVHHINQDEKVVAFHRWYDGGAKDSVIVVFNFRNQELDNYVVGVPSGGQWKVRFNSDWKGFDEEFTNNYTGASEATEGETDGMSHYISLSIGPYSVLILSQD
ncbi:1,4-alpha-glucan branching protein [Maribellus comscasis]|uniref:1,4-alpha-glucan branching enzyme n=2 Tax=Maribellus comscasis TaxID=2681766 RepID=A0A6I6K4B2_9BACT|nr:1,4-alpha-glucan branching protein [Maribellus comscasis]